MATATIAVTEGTTTGAARESLRAAVRAVEAAQQKAATAQTSAQRASDGVTRVRERLQNFANLDEHVHSFKVDCVRRGADPTLPHELQVKLRDREAATAELTSALRISETLGGEGTDALRTLERAQSDLSDAAAGLVLEEARTLAVELEAINAKRQLLRILLEQFLATNRSAHISGNAVAAALADEGRQLPADGSPLRLAGDYWHRQTEKLTRDVEAPLEPLPTLRDLFGY